MAPEFILPDWPAPTRVRALLTTRRGGVSTGVYANFNLGSHVGDAPDAVARNRALLRAQLPAEPRWMSQVHGTAVAHWRAGDAAHLRDADAAWTRDAGVVCAVLTADCLPVLLCDAAGSAVGVVHAGWRGLAGGALEAAVAAMRLDGVPAQGWLAYLGPAIGARAFEVGPEVREAFVAGQDGGEAAACFQRGRPGKWLADLAGLARLRLHRLGITAVYGGTWCTYSQPDLFYSHRRATVTGEPSSGRMASCIWLAQAS